MTALIWNSENMFPLSSIPVWLKKTKQKYRMCMCVHLPVCYQVRKMI